MPTACAPDLFDNPRDNLLGKTRPNSRTKRGRKIPIAVPSQGKIRRKSPESPALVKAQRYQNA
jgi:hypothetical protein